MFALTWPGLTLVTDVDGSRPGGVADGVTDRNVGWLPGALLAAVTLTITPVTSALLGTTPFAPRIGSVSCCIVPIGWPPGQPAGVGAERVSSSRDGGIGLNRAPESAPSTNFEVEIHPNTSIRTWADPFPCGVTIEIVDWPPAPMPSTARFGTASAGPKLTRDDSPGAAPVG